jgi:LPXTG-motif cell wall-anchored protein
VETTTVVSQEPPTPPTTPAPSTTTKEQSGGLPSTGGTPMPGLLIGFGAICLGVAMVLTRRRTAPR